VSPYTKVERKLLVNNVLLDEMLMVKPVPG
jgi:hypothetical protein